MLELDESLNEQAIQLEILINRMRPDLLKRMSESKRTDIRFLEQDANQFARDILVENGMIKNEQTVLLDQITGTQPNQNYQQNQAP